jgi:hypothetical protein
MVHSNKDNSRRLAGWLAGWLVRLFLNTHEVWCDKVLHFVKQSYATGSNKVNDFWFREEGL